MPITTDKVRAFLTARGETVSDAPDLTGRENDLLRYHLEQLGVQRTHIEVYLSFGGTLPTEVEEIISGGGDAGKPELDPESEPELDPEDDPEAP